MQWSELGEFVAKVGIPGSIAFYVLRALIGGLNKSADRMVASFDAHATRMEERLSQIASEVSEVRCELREHMGQTEARFEGLSLVEKKRSKG